MYKRQKYEFAVRYNIAESCIKPFTVSELEEVCRCDPVSYTHLDVYKRQARRGGVLGGIALMFFLVAVSYTHLDVYKRQVCEAAVSCDDTGGNE